MNAPTLPKAQAALSAAQHKASLWSDRALAVYAVVMGQRVAGLPERLAQAQAAPRGADSHCLVPGALSPAQQAAAPYLVALQPESAFTDWLLFEAAAGFGDWGVLLRSSRGLIDIRSHARNLCQAQTAAGQPIRLDWMDPAVLRVLLPLAPPDQLQTVFGALDALLILEPARWTQHRLALGRLHTQTTELVAAG